jgi:hypothetical protein
MVAQHYHESTLHAQLDFITAQATLEHVGL